MHRPCARVGADPWTQLAIRLADAMTSRMIRFREAHENKDQFCDVQYNALTKDPIAVVRSIYRHYGMTVSAEVWACMHGWIARMHASCSAHRVSRAHVTIATALATGWAE